MRRGDKYWNKGAETKQSGAAEGRILDVDARTSL
jgi:hypothetical protein